MDVFKPEVWKQQWEAFVSAPYIMVPLLALVALATWFLRSQEIRSIKAQLSARDDIIRSKESLIQVVEAKVTFQKEAREVLESEIKKLKAMAVEAPSESNWVDRIALVERAVLDLKKASVSIEASLSSTEPSDSMSARISVE